MSDKSENLPTLGFTTDYAKYFNDSAKQQIQILQKIFHQLKQNFSNKFSHSLEILIDWDSIIVEGSS